jgi:hypothetical protein
MEEGDAMRGRILASVTLLLALGHAAPAAPVLLREKLAADDCFRLEVRMDLKGEMTFRKNDKPQSLPLEATARHVFPERVLMVAKNGNAEKVARLYETAEAVIKTGKYTSRRTLRTDRRLLVAQWHNDALLTYSPAGPLLSDELDLCSDHFDTLHLTGLLPGEGRSVGDTWKVSNEVVMALCHFEGLTEQSLAGKLEEVKDGKALFSIRGPANGIDLGSLVKITVDARGVFDLASRRLVRLEWKQKDEREQGPANPASLVEATTVVERSAVPMPESLGVVALSSVPEGLKAPPLALQMEYRHPRQAYALTYPRDWHIVSQTEEHLVMRLMERGDFVAQVTVAVWEKKEAGKHLSPDEFAETTGHMPGWSPARTLDAREVPTDNGCWVYRLVLAGDLKGVEVVQHFYLVANADGRQVMLGFCMTPKQADRLGTRDLSLVAGLEFPARK